MELKEGMICKHFKGKDLIEKNIYKIVAVKPEYTGERTFTADAIVIYKPLFQEGKCFVREYDDLVAELNDEKKGLYQQTYRIEPLTEKELEEISTPDFIKEKLKYLEQVWAKEEAERLAKKEMRKKELENRLKQAEETNLEQIDKNKKQL